GVVRSLEPPALGLLRARRPRLIAGSHARRPDRRPRTEACRGVHVATHPPDPQTPATGVQPGRRADQAPVRYVAVGGLGEAGITLRAPSAARDTARTCSPPRSR